MRAKDQGLTYEQVVLKGAALDRAVGAEEAGHEPLVLGLVFQAVALLRAQHGQRERVVVIDEGAVAVL